MIRLTSSISIKKVQSISYKAALAFTGPIKGTSRLKFVWEARSRVSSTGSVIEETLMF